MRSFTLFAALIAGSLAKHVIHEKRDFIPSGWEKGERLEGHLLMPMRIALTQTNLDALDARLSEVSDPASSKYGNHWTQEEVAKFFQPSEATRTTVADWLVSGGIERERVDQGFTPTLGWIHIDVTVAEAEKLLQTKYHKYQHSTGKVQWGTEAYSVPAAVKNHIDFITPTLHFDAKLNYDGDHYDGKLQKRVPVKDRVKSRFVRSKLGDPGSGSLPKQGFTAPTIQSVFDQLKNCSDFITPVCLRALYNIPPPMSNVQTNPFGIVEYTPQSYLQTDLNTFFSNFSKNQKQKTPTLVSIDGGTVSTTPGGFELNGESDLDLEYGMALVNPISVTLYQVGDSIEGASFGDFLDALDGSYCSGDDPNFDATYPDPNPAGYQGQKNCGQAPLTKVISTSYGYNEVDLTPAYEQRQCNEYAKLGLMGTSFLFSSGDYGVAGNGGQCLNADGSLNNGGSGRFNPAFPSTCPYITSVGATQIPTGGSVTTPETACETVIYSGGGFSNVFPIPSYQSSAVAGFLSAHPPPYTSAQYNNSGTVRAYPDVSANGANYLVEVDSTASLVYGTSASAPVFASIITIINEYRALKGKKSLGFLNPFFYSNPTAFTDIVAGGNQGCGTNGFTATTGWDPVTGLGTPKSNKLLQLAVNLP